jgi:hypothetical protein
VIARLALLAAAIELEKTEDAIEAEAPAASLSQ